MGIQNAVARKLAVPDLTTTVVTMTITGIAADSSLAGGNNVRIWRRISAVILMLVGAFTGAVIVLHAGIALTLLVATLITACSSLAGYVFIRPAAAYPRATGG